MPCATRSLLSSMLVAPAFWPAAGTAEAQHAPPAGPRFTVDGVREAFTGAGYEVDRTYTWDWTSPPVTWFQVHDRTTDRLLMVLVYPDPAAAQTRRRQAQSGDRPVTSGGPHLVPGYGQSLWSGNVALVQTTCSQLERLCQFQADRDNGVCVNPDPAEDPSLPDLAVDLDFEQALQNGAVDL